MNCKYSYYKDNEKYFPKLYCKVNNDIQCILSKQCDKVGKWIHIENKNYKECIFMKEAEMKNIPKGSYYIIASRPSKNGLYIYVSINGNAEKIETDFVELNQNYIYVKKYNNKYKVSLTPFRRKNEK